MLKNPLRDFPGYALRRVSAAAMSELAARLSSLELTAAEASVLIVTGANAGAMQSEIGRALGIVSANMAPLAARLEQRGLIERAPIDRRSFGLQLTRRGAELSASARAAMEEQERAFIKGTPPALRPAFKSALQAMLTALDEAD